ncbi:MAG: prepilin-type N-terminal cleavage/methylation domain-containing protein [Candidatus Omnitrophota bacterium]|nr:prepilin-type N-terminal cleavage/methylation domain-containing protein [Candidatus Omnitrophota bacterium]
MGNRGTTTSRIGSKGFTLIELLFVCVILALLLAGVLPRFQGTLQRLRVERAAFELTQLLRYAHERAVTEAQAVVWTWDEASRQVRLEMIEDDGDAVPLQERMAHSAPVGTDLSVELSVAGQAVDCRCVRFSPDGTSGEEGLREPTLVTVASGELRYLVTVDATTSQVALSAGRAAR